MTREEYEAQNTFAAMVANTIEQLPLGEMVDMVNHSEAVGPILDPTLYRQKAGDLQIDGRRLRILLTAQRALKELRQQAEARTA